MRVPTLLAVLAVAVAAAAGSDADWWRSALVYQIYPRSFKDSNGDGIGDLNDDTIILNGHVLSVIHDPPHLIKGLRNNFLTKDIKFNGKISKWSDIVEVYKADCCHAQMRLLHKLNDEHVIPEKIKKMKVKNCVRVFSKTMAATLSFTAQFCITEKLPYLKETGIDAIWMSPIYLSPMYDFGYDITDYRKIAPEYGTMEDFDNLMMEAKALGIRVILDYVPNHTSNDSEWFVKSKNGDEDYKNYFVWADGKIGPNNVTQPPNNWVSVFRKSAWEWSEERQQYYLHQFVIGQPDLNYREPKVQQEMKDVLSFWMDKGVSGFRVDAINMMYEVDPNDYNGVYPDEPLSGDPNAVPDDYEYLDHIYTRNLPETYNVVYDWRDLLNNHTAKDGEYKIMMTEAYADLDLMIKYYGDGRRNGSIPFNFSFLGDVNNHSNARDIKMVIDKWLTYMPCGEVANWVNGNHDQSRMASRQGTDRVDAMNMLALLLPGVSITYQGEEIGMTDGFVSWEDTKDPQACNTDDPINYYKRSRDPNRTPYHWDASAHAGFSNTFGATWLPVADNYKTLNLANQRADPKSHYQFYRDVAKVKKTYAVRNGDVDTRALSDSILVVTRLEPFTTGVVGIVNLSDNDQVVDLSSLKLLPYLLRVTASGVSCSLQKGTYANKTSVTVSAHCAVVLETIRWCC